MTTVIQSVTFDKGTFSKRKAKDWMKRYGLHPIKEHELVNTIRYRQHTPDKSAKYTTVEVRPGVQLTLMKTKRVKGGFDLSLRTPPSVDSYLKRYGDQRIVSMVVCRVPLGNALHGLLNMITLGKAKDFMKSKNYDHYFHLFCIITLENGVHLKIEKSEEVKITQVSEVPRYSAMEMMPVPKADNSNRTFGEFWERTLKTYPYDFIFRYDAVNSNCQRFITSLLQANGWDYPRLRFWVNQNVKDAIDSPVVSKFLNITTDLKRHINGFLSKLGF